LAHETNSKCSADEASQITNHMSCTDHFLKL
jgi:hypothetical protein